MKKVDDELINKLNTRFNALDIDRDGVVGKDELRQAWERNKPTKAKNHIRSTLKASQLGAMSYRTESRDDQAHTSKQRLDRFRRDKTKAMVNRVRSATKAAQVISSGL